MAQKNLTQGAVWRALAAVSAPMSLGILGVLSVGLADAYFLGQLGEAPLAAVGFIYPVTTAVTSLSIGLSAGANAAISQSLGRGDSEAETNRLSVHAIVLGTVVATLVALAFYLGAGALFSVMGAKDDVLAEAQSYAPFWALSFPFLVGMALLNAVFRAHGDGATSAMIMLVAAVLNVALDPVLIYGLGPVPEMSTAGAALATAVARVLTLIGAFSYALRIGVIRPPEVFTDGIGGSVREVIRVGLPAAFSNAINPAGMAMVTAAAATLGDTVVAGLGAAQRVQSVALVPLLALSAGIGPVVGQNWGADQQARARLAVWRSWQFCVGYGLAMALVLTLFASDIAGLLTSDQGAAATTAQYLRIVSWSFLGYGVLVTANAAMNARSKAVWSMGLSLMRIFAIYVPLAWLGVWMFGYAGILGAAVIANLAAVPGAYFTGRRTGLVAR
ncbi:putative multi antimicrobial extrusion protein (plasmid) [Phaeobacter piscinae]|uniref:Multi antimicrobial extrusion protein n=1 Tax=Phaeobacter piscinae TaxID=1580596 RepID=A0AAN1LCA4_9RHOB|nr:MATE family efflux transporter [Phaeobacter piscinae]ATG45420.1 putative multi antimicrobial extrusion protein [Phaeobacter piscinae]AUR37982.1 putative multi antimicrobial extrusion protein [Phaeobacter piscinae]